MATPASKPATKPASKAASKPTTKRTKAMIAAAAEDPTTSEGVAQAMRVESIDLVPSINRIMNAGLHEAACFRAITLFRDSIGVPGDPHRYPDNAIEAGRKVPEAAAAN
ncbi:MAG: hypothetical protein QOC57_1496 [Ilumatobacteraceae bacterium]|jgi:hypothetical protein|nr:hypothetical protein [Ilumatobacteraceae bacterium]